MKFEEKEWLEKEGFEGFLKIKDLKEQEYLLSTIPTQSGVYVSLRLSNDKPKFCEVSTGGHYEGKDPKKPIAKLQKKWVEDSVIMYIGESCNLQERISLYLEFSQGKAVRHWGGRYVWQLEDADELVVCWKVCKNAENKKYEMLTDFKAEHGALPFANIVLRKYDKEC